MLSLITQGSINKFFVGMLLCGCGYAYGREVPPDIYQMAEKEIGLFVEKDFIPFPLSYINYVQENIADYKNFYIYKNKIKTNSAFNGMYVIPFLYNTENETHHQDAFQRCNIAITTSKRVVISAKTFDKHNFGSFSHCLGYESINVFSIKDKIWIRAKVGYMGPQSGDALESFGYEYYYISKPESLFCYDDNVSSYLGKENKIDKTKMKLMSYTPDMHFCKKIEG